MIQKKNDRGEAEDHTNNLAWNIEVKLDELLTNSNKFNLSFVAPSARTEERLQLTEEN